MKRVNTPAGVFTRQKTYIYVTKYEATFTTNNKLHRMPAAPQ
jgi:hypothetical protein